MQVISAFIFPPSFYLGKQSDTQSTFVIVLDNKLLIIYNDSKFRIIINKTSYGKLSNIN